MKGPFERYAELLPLKKRLVPRDRVPDRELILGEVEATMAALRLHLGSSIDGCTSVIFPGSNDERMRAEIEPLYSLAAPDEVLDAVRAHIAHIATFGSGIVWFLLDPVHVITDNDDFVGDADGNVILRTFYAHEKKARLS